MRTDILEIEQFYESSLGRAAADFVAVRVRQAWTSHAGQRVVSFGYATPYLSLFSDAENALALMPEAMGVVTSTQDVPQCLTSDLSWPLSDASVDRVFIVHGLEETAQPRRLMREVWRVLADDGKLIVIVPNRRGPWAMVENTPFSAGRPYLKGQLDRLLRSAMFVPTAWSSALHFPPMGMRFMLRAARAWENAGDYLNSPLGGVILVEAIKQIAVPAGGTAVRSSRARVLRPASVSSSKVATDTDIGQMQEQKKSE